MNQLARIKTILFPLIYSITILPIYQLFGQEITSIDNISTSSFFNLESKTNEDNLRKECLLTFLYDYTDFKLTKKDFWSLKLKFEIQGNLPHETIIDSIKLIHDSKGSRLKKTKHYFLSSRSLDVNIREIEKTGISHIPDSIFFKISYRVDDVKAFNPKQAPTIINDNQSIVSWTKVQGATSYDLEWVHIDIYDKGRFTSPFDYKMPTTINIEDTFAIVDTLYPAGTLYYRSRAISKVNNTNDHKYLIGKWSNYFQIPINDGFEKNQNWFLETNYAEYGKTKKLVTYQDGLNRKRQQSTILSSDSTTVVQDYLYNNSGISELIILPSPQKGTDLKYQSNLNKKTGSNEKFSHEDIKSNNPDGLSNESGAGKYYSSNNSFTEFSHRDFIPDAEGYPYIIRHFKNDPTQKLRLETGVGKTFSKGNGREIEYFYGNVNDTELKRLFGINAGKSRQYYKLTKQDQNNQTYNTYYNANTDEIVATSLAGANPVNLSKLSSNKGSVLTFSLNENNVIDYENYVSTGTYNITNLKTTEYNFNYELTGVNYNTSFQNEFGVFDFCSTCEYRIEVIIIRPNGSIQKELVDTLSNDNYFLDNHEELCENPSYSKGISFKETFTDIGTYTVTKNLSLISGELSESIRNETVNTYLNAVKSEVEEARNEEIDLTGCYGNCLDTCMVSHSENYCRSRCAELSMDEDFLKSMLESQYTMYLRQLENDISPDGWIGNSVDTLNKYMSGCMEYQENTDGSYQLVNIRINCHPEYCMYQHFDDLIPSKIFDLQLLQTQKFERARLNGYLNPLGVRSESIYPPYTDQHISTSPKDPYFDDSRYGLRIAGIRLFPYYHSFEYIDVMIDSLSNFWHDEENDIYISIWEFLFNSNYFDKLLKEAPNNDLEKFFRCLKLPDYYRSLLPFDENGNVNNDFKWNIFKTIYIGFKEKIHEQILQKSYNCRYFDNPNAHFEKPYTNETIEDVETQKDEILHDYCVDICKYRAERWSDLVAFECSLNDEKRSLLVPLFSTYCQNNCSASTPFVLLTAQDLQSGDPILNEIKNIAGCDFSEVFPQEDLFEYEELCVESCFQGINPECLNHYIQFLTSSLQSSIEMIDLMDDKHHRTFLKCMNVNPDGFPNRYFRIEDNILSYRKNKLDKPTCSLSFFKDKSESPISLDDIEDVILLQTTMLEKDTFRVKIQLKGEENLIDAYLTGDCFNDSKYCTKNKLPDKCAQRVLQGIEDLTKLSNTPKNIYGCGELAYRDNKILYTKEKTCEISFVSVKGITIDVNHIDKVYTPKIVPYLPEGLQYEMDGLGYSLMKVRVILKPFKNCDSKTIDAYIYSNCNFGFEDECYSVPVCFNNPIDQDRFNNIKDCIQNKEDEAERIASQEIYRIIEDYEQHIDAVHNNECFDRPFLEEFSCEFEQNEYHYVLYYHDLAGNLRQTVPPAGVDTLSSEELELIGEGEDLQPEHLLASTYKYNARNQVMEQKSPDGGRTEFWYNRAGQLRFSQNDVQREKNTLVPESKKKYHYSFTKYDQKGRIIASGLLVSDNAITDENIENPKYPNIVSNAEQTLYDLNLTIYDTVAHGRYRYIQENLRGRVSARISAKSINDTVSVTYYSYDPTGNVKTLIQDIKILSPKRIDYDYDLVTGNINYLYYQKDSIDQFTHKYKYDSDNRITEVYTSTDNVTWHNDAKYYYYPHGPLARLELGEHQVQGIDYTYTLQGWLKGINSNTLKPHRDPGKDGLPGSENEYFAKDAYGITLGYYPGDYKPIKDIDQDSHFEAKTSNSALARAGPGLYNGNISQMVTAIDTFLNVDNSAFANAYKYDQLNRLDSSRVFLNQNISANEWSGLNETSVEFESNYAYDPNGNITRLNRNAYGSPNAMDRMVYSYNMNDNGKLISNKLYHINDEIPNDRFTDDIDDQGDFDSENLEANNYDYDAIGNLVKDNSSGIDSIGWNAYGKIDTLIKHIGLHPNLGFRYDADQNRVIKTLFAEDGTDNLNQVYVRTADGNVLAIYHIIEDTVKLKEFTIYGSNRLGIISENKILSHDLAISDLQIRQYELANHLKNVLVTLSMRKSSDQQYLSYKPEIFSEGYFYPYGMNISKYLIDKIEFRYGFGGMEKDNKFFLNGGIYTTKLRNYNPYIGRWLQADPKSQNYVSWSPYNLNLNNPIYFIDSKGDAPASSKTTVVLGKAEFEFPPNASQILNRTLENALELGVVVKEQIGVTEVADGVPGMVYLETNTIYIAENDKERERTMLHELIHLNPEFREKSIELSKKAVSGEISKSEFIKQTLEIEFMIEQEIAKIQLESRTGKSWEELMSQENSDQYEEFVSSEARKRVYGQEYNSRSRADGWRANSSKDFDDLRNSSDDNAVTK